MKFSLQLLIYEILIAWDSFPMKQHGSLFYMRIYQKGENSSNYWNLSSLSQWANRWRFQKISNSFYLHFSDFCDTLETSTLHVYQRKQITDIMRDILQLLFLWFSILILIYGRELLSGHISYCTKLYNKWKITQRMSLRDLFIMAIDVSSLFKCISRMIVLYCGMQTREH